MTHLKLLSLLNKHAPLKEKLLRANHALFITKTLRKAIMCRSQLETKCLKSKTLQTIRTSNYTKSIKTFVVSYTKGKEENIISPQI